MPPIAGAPTVRHPGDIVRAVTGAAGLAATSAVAVQGRLSNVETDVFRLVNDLPGGFDVPLRVVMQGGSLVAVPVAAGAALAARRPAAARDLAVAGGLAWFAAKGVKALVGRGRPGAFLHDVVFRGTPDPGLGFPSGHTAVAAALAAAASPYLGTNGRRAAWAGVAVVALARIYVGAHLPVDVIGGALVGWTIAAVVHLVFGTPVLGADPATVAATLERVFQRPFRVARASVDARGSSPFLVERDEGERWFVKVVSGVQRDADLAFKVWRALTRRGLEDEAPFATPKQQVEHEAFLSLLATRAGVRTPAFVTAADQVGGAILVFERLDGSTVDDAITDATLADVWDQVVLLRAARIAHRDLRLANVMVDDEGRAWLVDFGFSEAAASDRRLAQDVAELVTSSAVAVGADRAVAAAVAAVGRDALTAAVPLLQPLALSSATRAAVHHAGRHDHDLLGDVRRVAADAAGVETPALEPLARVRVRTVVLLAAAAFAIHLLLPQVGELRLTVDAFTDVRIGWLIAGLAASAATYLAAGLGMLGSVDHPIPYVRTTEVQLASTFANRITPANLGGAGVNVRYLQRSGLDRSEAWAAIALNTTAGAIVHIVALLIAGLEVGRRGVDVRELPARSTALVVLLAVLVVAGAVLWSPLGRRRLLPPLRGAARSVIAVLRRPSKAAQLFGGSVALTTMYVVALAVSLRSVGADVSILHVTAVYLGAAAVASVAPTPGGIGAMEAALIAGLTAFGAASGPTIAGVLIYRLLTYWLPILPGWVEFRRLQRAHVL